MTLAIPELSVVIPSFGRPEPLKYTLRSVARAREKLGSPVEILLVDDGSSPPMTEQLGRFDAGSEVTHVRQSNQGSIIGRLTGLAAARGEYVLFLDSDDLVHPDKFSAQLAAMRLDHADVSYADMATATLGEDHEISSYAPAEVLRETRDPATFYIEVQPAPHNPIYRRSYLQRALSSPIVAPVRGMDPAGDVWLFYNLSIADARITKISGSLSAAGPHEEERYSRHWEKLGVAAIQVMERFIRLCPRTGATVSARQAAGEAAFRTWRSLPRDYDPAFLSRMLGVYADAPKGPSGKLGTRSFARLAALMGPVAAGRLLRAARAPSYSKVGTLPAAEYERLFSEFSKTR
jgi:glycosyltransferase involved in cell wall biosynthesis